MYFNSKHIKKIIKNKFHSDYFIFIMNHIFIINILIKLVYYVINGNKIKCKYIYNISICMEWDSFLSIIPQINLKLWEEFSKFYK